jgi:regulatory protein
MYISDGMRLKKKGKYLLKFELIQRGIDEKIISEVFDEIEVNEVELAKTLIKKKYNLQDEITDKEKQKIYGMLARKGYSYSDIKQALYEVINDE